MDTNKHELISDLRSPTSELVSISVYSWLQTLLLCCLSFFLFTAAPFASAQIGSRVPDGGGNTIEPAPISPPGDGEVLPGPTPISDGTPPITTQANGETDWKNAGSTGWNTAGNWTVVSGNAPPAAGDVAWFTSAFSSGQPSVNTAVNIAGLYFSSTTSSGYIFTRTASNAFTLTGSATAIGAETGNASAVAIGANNTSGTNKISVAIALAPASGTTSTFSQAAGGTLDLNSSISVISGSGVSLSLIGGGTFILGGASTYNGGTTLSDGTLVAAVSSNAGTTLTTSAVGTGTFHLGSGTNLVTLQSDAAGGTIRLIRNSISLEGDITFSPGPGQTTGRIALDPFTGLTVPGTFTLTRTNQLTVATGETVDFFGSITGAFGITKLGAGTLNIGGSAGTPTDNQNNTYSGLTTINGGTYFLSKVAGTDAIAGDIQIDSGMLALAANNQIKDTASMTINAGSFSLGSRLETIANLTMNGGSVTGGLGTLTIAGAGSAVINSGSVSVLNFITGTAGLTLGSGATVASTSNGGVTTLNGDVSFNGATTGATLGSAGGTTSGVTLNGNRSFTVADATAATDLTVAGVVSNGTVAGSGLTKLGAGTMVLSAANTYTGATQVNAGTLFVNGSLVAASAVTVNNSGSVLGGTGTVNGSVSIASSGAVLDGGTGTTGATQKLTINGALSMSSGSIIELALGATGAHSTLALTGAGPSSFATTQHFNFIDTGATAGTYQDIITGVTSNPFTTDTFVIDNTGWFGSFSWDGANIDLTLTAVPEPSTWIAGGLAFAALLISQRRRLKKLAARS